MVDSLQATFWLRISLKYVVGSPVDKKASIGAGDGLPPNKCLAITWTSDDQTCMCHLCLLLLTYINFNPGMDKWLHPL